MFSGNSEQPMYCIFISGDVVLFLHRQGQPALVSSVFNPSGLNMGCVGTKPEQDPIGKSMGNSDSFNQTPHYTKDPTSKAVSRSILEFPIKLKRHLLRIIPEHDFRWKVLRWAKPSVLVVSAHIVTSNSVLPLSHRLRDRVVSKVQLYDHLDFAYILILLHI